MSAVTPRCFGVSPVCRQKKGTFGKEPPKDLPKAGFDQWDAAKKAACWIDALEEVDAHPKGQAARRRRLFRPLKAQVPLSLSKALQ